MRASRNPNLSLLTPAETESGDWQKNLGRSRLNLSVDRSSDWWTGLPPAVCPGYDETGKLRSLPIPNLETCSRSEVLDYFNNSWTLTDLLFSALNGEEGFYRPPYHSLRHPLIFYYVHPAVLYINKLQLAGILTAGINEYFERLFETGVDEMSWDDMSKNEIEWPPVHEAVSYRREVYAIVKSIIESHPDLADGHKAIGTDQPLWALFMSFEHERIHLETSSVLMRELPVHLLSRPAAFPEPCLSAREQSFPPRRGHEFPENDFLSVAGELVHYGKQQNWPTFGWDNEYGQRSRHTAEFKVSKHLMSNGEFWQFVSDGGYHEPENWSETGWRWRSFRNVKFPTFWVPDGPDGSQRYKLRTCFEIIDMQWDWPAVVNFHEARAFSLWKSRKENKNYRMITEAEQQTLRKICALPNDDRLNLTVPEPFNINLRRGSESPVDRCKSGNAEIYDLFGNVWQWCEDHFNPLEGSQVHPYYADFSTPCYDGQHQMILGGSFISTGDEASAWARFHFRPHFFQHAGFRLVEADESNNGEVFLIGRSAASLNREAEESLNQALLIHYAHSDLQMPHPEGPQNACNFPLRCADLLVAWCHRLSLPTRKAIEFGCSVGGAVFRLAETFDQVIGADLQRRKIETAESLKNGQAVNFVCKVRDGRPESGKTSISKEAASRAAFLRAEPASLPEQYEDFDAVLLSEFPSDLLDRESCLKRLYMEKQIPKSGGLLLAVTEFNITEEAGRTRLLPESGSDIDRAKTMSFEFLKKSLEQDFELLELRDMPVLIPLQERSYRYLIPRISVWRRL